MITVTRFQFRRTVLAAFVLVFSLMAGLQARPAHARSVGGCRTDPIVYLSNGLKIQLTSQMGTTSDKVTMITYTVRVPAGLTLGRVQYMGGAWASKERVLFYADQPAGQYTTTTRVETTVSGVSVKAITTILRQLASKTGQSGQDLTVTLYR